MVRGQKRAGDGRASLPQSSASLIYWRLQGGGLVSSVSTTTHSMSVSVSVSAHLVQCQCQCQCQYSPRPLSVAGVCLECGRVEGGVVQGSRRPAHTCVLYVCVWRKKDEGREDGGRGKGEGRREKGEGMC